jgi:heme A synthase
MKSAFLILGLLICLAAFVVGAWLVVSGISGAFMAGKPVVGTVILIIATWFGLRIFVFPRSAK